MRALKLICLILLFASQVQAGEVPPSPIAKTALAIATGKSPMAAVTFTLPPHWHIYWQNPGDSGIAPSFQWGLPKGVVAGAIQWPTPKRFAMGDIINYGYADTVTLLVPLTGATAAKGEATLHASWLVCEEICIPEKATLTASIPSEGAEVVVNAARDRLPVPLNGTARYDANDQRVIFEIRTNQVMEADAQFFPITDGIIANDGNASLTQTDGVVQFTLPRTQGELPATFDAVIRSGDAGFSIRAQRSPTPLILNEAPSLWLMLGFALLGGLLLNLMPCVLPILSLKAIALVKKAAAHPRDARLQGVGYTLGVVIGFLAIAGIGVAIKAAGLAAGWGFQLQQPVVVAGLVMLMVLVALNLLGRFEVPVLLGSARVETSGLRGSVLTGLLAVALATPCTTPFMAPALGATLVLPLLPSLLIFAGLGFGMALPFLLISFWPAALRALPKPGAWMARFKQWMALPVLATALWLLSVQFALNGITGVAITAVAVLLVTVLVSLPRIRWILVIGAIAAGLALQPAKEQHATTPLAFEAYSQTQLEALRAQGTPVFVNATADWCITCKFNERAALKTERVQSYFKEHKVVYMVADWTRGDAAITEHLARFQRNGVPLYVYYPPNKEPVVLPQLLTPATILDTLSQP